MQQKLSTIFFVNFGDGNWR